MLFHFCPGSSLQPGEDFIDGLLPADEATLRTEHDLMGMWIFFLFRRRHVPSREHEVAGDVFDVFERERRHFGAGKSLLPRLGQPFVVFAGGLGKPRLLEDFAEPHQEATLLAEVPSWRCRTAAAGTMQLQQLDWRPLLVAVVLHPSLSPRESSRRSLFLAVRPVRGSPWRRA